jgi:hypothetical protein
MMQMDQPFLDFQNGVEVTTTTVKTATEVRTTTVTALIPMGNGVGVKGIARGRVIDIVDEQKEGGKDAGVDSDDSSRHDDDDLYD